ncbi:MAG: Holliday junction resolvase RuvX [Ruminococcaceae bacterium]|nr:Holliday junction resolvase RuvX [Oscillospiraceae bacterium]
MAEKILGVDFGDTRTGLAISDSLGMLANGIGYVNSTYIVKTAELVAEKARELGAAKIVVGLPINMNGTIGPRAEHAKEFAELLRENTGLPVEMFDERCSTMAAHQILNFTDTRGKKRKAAVDTLSAQIILQNYLDSHR